MCGIEAFGLFNQMDECDKDASIEWSRIGFEEPLHSLGT